MKYVDRVKFPSSVKSHNLSQSPSFKTKLMVASPIHFIRELLRSLCHHHLPPKSLEFAFIQEPVLKQIHEVVSHQPYICFIGMDTYGIILAGMVAEKTKTPLFYYSLELRYSTSPLYRNDPFFASLKELERKYHEMCQGTLIQSKERAAILFADNGLTEKNIWMLPVSIGEPPVIQRSQTLYLQHHLPDSQCLLLQLGFIGDRSLSLEIAEAASDFPQNWSIIFNGPMQTKKNFYQRMLELQKKYPQKRLCISEDLTNLGTLSQLVASAHIGIVAYVPSDLNEVHVLYASEKMARYLHCGLPIIGLNVPGLRELTEKYRFGVVIDDVSQMKPAVNYLLTHYEEYRVGAFKFFTEQFSFEKWITPFIDHLEEKHLEKKD
jgi:hypothetical protein